jgi:hypothetical protein
MAVSLGWVSGSAWPGLLPVSYRAGVSRVALHAPPGSGQTCTRTLSESTRGKSAEGRKRPPCGASIGRYKRVIGDALRSRTDRTEATEVALAAAALNRMLAFRRPNYVRIA